ncbi:hypothetical protein RYR39_003450 [Yersinia ruckeri]|nr:hypothetical protein [Yersinia ruckeri]ELM3741497.1 hypothetical protein [Yersinia ruckeri]
MNAYEQPQGDEVGKIKSTMHKAMHYKAPLSDWILLLTVIFAAAVAGIVYLIIDSF